MKKLASLLAGLTCTAGILFVLHSEHGITHASYATAAARRGDIEIAIHASGVVEPSRLVSVGAQVSGRLLTLNADLGDFVKTGQLIGEIDSVPQTNIVRKAQATLAGLEAQRERARANLRQAQLAFHRQSEIFSRKAGTRQDYEAAEALFASGKADLASVEAQIVGASIEVDDARTTLGYTRVTAPVAGTVVAVLTKQGQTVIASQVAPVIVKLADLRTMTVKARISEADVPRVRLGGAVYFTILAQPERRYTAVLRMIEPAPDQIQVDAAPAGQAGSGDKAAVYFNGRFDVDNTDGALRPFMTAEVTFVTGAAKSAVLVPSAAVRTTRATEGVVRVLDAKGGIAARQVRLGLDNGVDTQIVQGLDVGENVVLAGPEDAFRTPGMGS